ncbi:hypothetical protein TNCV_2064471 [Trichonephila clavipes]|nr:hypothetical protein TNCV_2064471 [Trichonephila clavipes]
MKHQFDESLTVQTAEQMEISTSSAYAILCDDLNTCGVVAKFVLKLLSVQQKEPCFAVTQNLHGSLQFPAVPENENTIERIPFSE